VAIAMHRNLMSVILEFNYKAYNANSTLPQLIAFGDPDFLSDTCILAFREHLPVFLVIF